MFTTTASQTHTKQTEDNVELKQSENEYSKPPDKDNARASTDTIGQICLWQRYIYVCGVNGVDGLGRLINFSDKYSSGIEWNYYHPEISMHIESVSNNRF